MLKALKHSRISVMHVVVVALSLSMTVGAWLYSKYQVELQISSRFAQSRDRTIGLIEDRMSRYEDALWSGVASIRAQGGDMTYQEWKDFAGSLNIEERYPGVNGIGVIYYVDRDELGGFSEMRLTEDRDFSIYPQHERDFLLPITFIEPEDINLAAIGLDVAHETNRRTALFASRDGGTSQITGPIILVQDSGHTPGFLFYAPFYHGAMPDTVEERREQFVGVVYAPFVVRKLVEGLLAKDLRDVRFRILDGDETIYDEHDPDEPLFDAQPMFQEVVDLDFYGRTWSIDIRTNLEFRAQNGSDQPAMILLGGLIIEVLVISMLLMMARASRMAHEYAQDLTSELRNKTESLELANAEIEQFVYVASHDLKTPVRGIRFVTDVLEEDLEEAMGPLDKKPEIALHLKMIRERVDRMNDLTKGIMDFSRIGNHGTASEPSLKLATLAEDCITDFEVEPTQLILESDVEAVACDTNNFRRVVENLVGNAFKYHPRPQMAKVCLCVTDEGECLLVSVKDDGKGITPEYQEKIFDVFQTLRKAGEPESTGIGLAIVKKAVQRHGYGVGVHSAEGKGAEFFFRWPKAAKEQCTIVKKVA